MEAKVFCEEGERDYKRIVKDLNHVSKILETRALYSHNYREWLKAFREFDSTPYKAARFIPFYAEEPGTFKPDDFAFTYAYDEYYLGRDFKYFSEGPEGGDGVWLSGNMYSGLNADAPFVYILRLKENVANYNAPILCILAFSFDLDRKTLFIEQIQGGDTWSYKNIKMPRHVKAAKRARFKFKEALPELFVYDAVEDLARRLGMRYIAIRRPEFNKWDGVKERAAKRPGSTLYDKVAERTGFSASDKYLQDKLPSVNTEVYFWKRLA